MRQERNGERRQEARQKRDLRRNWPEPLMEPAWPTVAEKGNQTRGSLESVDVQLILTCDDDSSKPGQCGVDRKERCEYEAGSWTSWRWMRLWWWSPLHRGGRLSVADGQERGGGGCKARAGCCAVRPKYCTEHPCSLSSCLAFTSTTRQILPPRPPSDPSKWKRNNKFQLKMMIVRQVCSGSRFSGEAIGCHLR